MGRPTIIIDAAHQAHVPALDPHSWHRRWPTADLQPGADERAVTVSVDVRSLNQSLRAAMRRLGTDAPLRERLGLEARAWWEREHTIERMTLDYERALTQALEQPSPAPEWPPHMRPEPAADARRRLEAPAWEDETLRRRLADL
jgi:hypothetical protein